MNYTKGEWNVQLAQPYDEHKFEVSYDTPEGLTYPIADILGKLEYGDAEANANLIASAPELYEACKFIDYMWRNKTSRYKAEQRQARELLTQALTKAEGGK